MGVDAIREAFRNARRVCFPGEAADDKGRSHRVDALKIETMDRYHSKHHPSGERNQASCYVDPDWTEEQRHEFEERAAIIEYDGQLPCNLAEFIAARIVDAHSR